MVQLHCLRLRCSRSGDSRTLSASVSTTRWQPRQAARPWTPCTAQRACRGMRGCAKCPTGNSRSPVPTYRCASPPNGAAAQGHNLQDSIYTHRAIFRKECTLYTGITEFMIPFIASPDPHASHAPSWSLISSQRNSYSRNEVHRPVHQFSARGAVNVAPSRMQRQRTAGHGTGHLCPSRNRMQRHA